MDFMVSEVTGRGGCCCYVFRNRHRVTEYERAFLHLFCHGSVTRNQQIDTPFTQTVTMARVCMHANLAIEYTTGWVGAHTYLYDILGDTHTNT